MMTEDLEERIIEGMGELKNMSREMLRRQDLTNGRVNSLEAWRDSMKIRDAENAGFARGSADTLITGRQLKAGVAVVTTIASLSGAITALIARFIV